MSCSEASLVIVAGGVPLRHHPLPALLVDNAIWWYLATNLLSTSYCVLPWPLDTA
jgi:hypothetical protein